MTSALRVVLSGLIAIGDLMDLSVPCSSVGAVLAKVVLSLDGCT